MVLATLFSPDQVRALDPHALGDIFGLTPTQARVAVLLADGLTAAEVAQQLGCALATVRTHIRQVLGKLGSRRLADAVRLLRQGEALWAQAGGQG
jgi:DNA-binding CsgD family transcriptional regulator